jgi:hypothetical protein
MSRDELEIEYLELCDELERESTQAGFERFFKDPEVRRDMRIKVKEANDMRESRAFPMS